MTSIAESARALGDVLREWGISGSLDYLVRCRIERELFFIAKALAKDHLSLDLTGFSLASRLQVEEHCKGTHDVSTSVVLRAFELTAVLRSLASGDPYLLLDLEDTYSLGRALPMHRFRKRLRSFVEFAVRAAHHHSHNIPSQYT